MGVIPKVIKVLGATGLAVAVGGLAACSVASTGGSGGADGPGRPVVVTTTTQTADFVREVGGDHVVVRSLARPGVEPHDFDPTPADFETVRTARLIVRNGAGLDSWLDDVVRAVDATAAVVDASQGLVLRTDPLEDDAVDPHIWHDPDNAGHMVATIATAMAETDPAHAADYGANLARYQAELRMLDADITAQLSPLTNRKVVTNHDAFGYFLDHYDLTLVATVIPSFDASAELSARDVGRLVDKLRAEGVTAIFAERALPATVAAALAREAGVRVVAGDDSLYGDALGPPGSDGATYLAMMRHNAAVLADNLRG